MAAKPQFTIRRFVSLDAMKAEEYQYWQGQPAHARLQAVTDMARAAFGLEDPDSVGRKLQRTLIRVRR